MRCDFNMVIGAARFVLPIRLNVQRWMCGAVAGAKLPWTNWRWFIPNAHCLH